MKITDSTAHFSIPEAVSLMAFGDTVCDYEEGTYVPASNSVSASILSSSQHPRIFIIYREDIDTFVSPDSPTKDATTAAIVVFADAYTTSGTQKKGVLFGLNTDTAFNYGYSLFNTTGSTFNVSNGVISLNTGNASRPFVAGVRYHYWVFG